MPLHTAFSIDHTPATLDKLLIGSIDAYMLGLYLLDLAFRHEGLLAIAHWLTCTLPSHDFVNYIFRPALDHADMLRTMVMVCYAERATINNLEHVAVEALRSLAKVQRLCQQLLGGLQSGNGQDRLRLVDVTAWLVYLLDEAAASDVEPLQDGVQLVKQSPSPLKTNDGKDLVFGLDEDFKLATTPISHTEMLRRNREAARGNVLITMRRRMSRE